VNKLAPIVLFTYNRLWHTQQTVEALQKNELAEESELFIYSDGGKDEKSWEMVKEVRQYLKTIGGFKNITIIEQERNLGLADSIISGVTKIIKEYGKIIVLEDDIVTSQYFLRFMNNALDFYEKKGKVWHISGWNYSLSNEKSNDTFLWRGMNCWGWATWADRWKYYKRNTTELIKSFSVADIYKFNFDGTHNSWSQVIANYENKINTWAIYWYATIFCHDGLCLNPTLSFVKNIGFDGSGTHCVKTSTQQQDLLNHQKDVLFPEKLEENIIKLDKIKLFYYQNSIYYENTIFINKLRLIYDRVNNLSKDSQYIIYGAGSGYNLIISQIKHNVVAVIDNNLYGNTEHGLPIIKPNDIKLFRNYKIIISLFDKQDEIRNMLIKSYCIDNSDIVLLA
jgi:GR25 family glycosyltransferase involved in LPS biosynthesis